MAGVGACPSTDGMAAVLCKPRPESDERFLLHELFVCAKPESLLRLALEEGLSLYELARAVRHAGVRVRLLSRTLERFAVRPVEGDPRFPPRTVLSWMGFRGTYDRRS